MIRFEDIKNNKEIKTYIKYADKALEGIGFTEHSFAHVTTVADRAAFILSSLGYSDRTIELCRIAAYMHDIGNVVSRVDHSQSGAMMAYRILNELGMDTEEIAIIITAIGNHDEGFGQPVDAISAAIIIADKSDVRRSRVRNIDRDKFDIHDRVNYSVVNSELIMDPDRTFIDLRLEIDIVYSPVIDFFDIFMERLNLCRKAAQKLGLKFKLHINGQRIS